MAVLDADARALSLAAIRDLEKIRDFEVEATQPERARAIELIDAYAEAELRAALGAFSKGTGALLDLIGLLAPRVAALGPKGAQTVARAGALLRGLHDREGLRSAYADDAEAGSAVADDEAELAPPPTPAAERPLDRAAMAGPRLHAPTPMPKGSYDALADEYIRFFLGADTSAHAARVGKQADIALRNRRRYEAVGDPLGIPWWFVAGTHMLESTFNFETHLHNGDPLGARTVRVPQGHPRTGGPDFTWEQSAHDALTLKKLGGLKDWSLPRALHRWELFNGWGYRKREVPVPTPYLWSLSSIYRSGKFVRDGVFDPNKVSEQCGAASLLKELHRRGEVTLHLDYTDEIGEDDPDDDDVAPEAGPPTGGGGGFADFLRRHVPELGPFQADDFLFLGGSNATAKLNSPPPESLWPNAVDLVRLLVEFQRRMGQRVRFNSLYRNPEYNKHVKGVAGSQHRFFRAADFRVVEGTSRPKDWAAALVRMRKDGVFTGGVGVYPTFVHVDTRGHAADWPKP